VHRPRRLQRFEDAKLRERAGAEVVRGDLGWGKGGAVDPRVEDRLAQVEKRVPAGRTHRVLDRGVATAGLSGAVEDKGCGNRVDIDRHRSQAIDDLRWRSKMEVHRTLHNDGAEANGTRVISTPRGLYGQPGFDVM
jgi:hypothetical protein